MPYFLDTSEYLDTDADGMGNNLDVLMMADGVADFIDTFRHWTQMNSLTQTVMACIM